MSTRTNALVSQRETGKIAASIILRYGRLAPGTYYLVNVPNHSRFTLLEERDELFRRTGGLKLCAKE